MLNFDFDDLGAQGSRPVPAWVATCEPAPALRNKTPRTRKKTSKTRPQPEAPPPPRPGEEGLELPPHLANYGVSRKYAQSGPSLLGIENDEGSVEYKLRLKEPSPLRFQQLVTQLKYRLSEGEGECFYLIGVEDNGHPRGLPPDQLAGSLGVLQAMAEEADAAATVLRTPDCEGGLRCAVVHVRRRCTEEAESVGLRVAVAGAVASGKSTLVAVLTQGRGGGQPLLDDGRGSARMSVFRHKHEIESGHTSSISQHLLGYDAAGRVINYEGVSRYTPAEVASCAVRVVQFVDTGGHEKYAKTALAGLTATLPDYALITVCAATGVSWATREHLAVALALGVPAFVVLTKADLLERDEAALDSLVADVRCLVGAALGLDGGQECPPSLALAPSPLAATAAPLVESEAQARQLAPAMLHSRVRAAPPAAAAQQAQHAQHAQHQEQQQQLVVPIFKVSSVSGRGLGVLHAFLQALRPEVERLQVAEAPPLRSHPAGLPSAAAAAAVEGEDAAAVPGTSEAVAGGLGELCLEEPGPSSTAIGATELAQGWFRPHSSQADQAASSNGAAPAVAAGSAAEAVGASSSSSTEAAGAVRVAAAQQPAHFQIEEGFVVAGVGPVYSGRLVSGSLTLGSRLLLGPRAGRELEAGSGNSSGGGFSPVRVVGLHRSQLPVARISQGQIATVAVALESEPPAAEEPNAEEGGEASPAGEPTSAVAAAKTEPPVPAVSGAQPTGTAAHLAGTCWDLSEHLGDGSVAAAEAAEGGAGAPARRHRERHTCPKGSVLLDPRLQPEAHWEFEAVLVLLGGHWPARGLMSGRWPPEEPAEGDACAEPAVLSSDAVLGSSLQSRGSAKRPPIYTAVVHCGSIRQAAQVVSIQELPLPSPGASPLPSPTRPSPAMAEAAAVVDPDRIQPALAAARVLRASGWVPSAGGYLGGSQGGGSPEGSGDWGSLLAGQRSGSGAALLRTGSGSAGGHALGRSPGGSGRLGGGSGAGLARWLGGASSSVWSDSGELSSGSYDSGSASEWGGRWASSERRVGWAEDLLPPGSQGQQEQGSQGAVEGGEGQPADRQRLARHPSLTAARHDPDLGCLARVRLRFVKRPEWVVGSARLVVRDRGGRAAAAAVGYVL